MQCVKEILPGARYIIEKYWGLVWSRYRKAGQAWWLEGDGGRCVRRSQHRKRAEGERRDANGYDLGDVECVDTRNSSQNIRWR